MSRVLSTKEAAAIRRDGGISLEEHRKARVLAQSFLDRADEDWTFVDPEEIKALARAVLGK